jgi:hypothetical protein
MKGEVIPFNPGDKPKKNSRAPVPEGGAIITPAEDFESRREEAIHKRLEAAAEKYGFYRVIPSSVGSSLEKKQSDLNLQITTDEAVKEFIKEMEPHVDAVYQFFLKHNALGVLIHNWDTFEPYIKNKDALVRTAIERYPMNDGHTLGIDIFDDLLHRGLKLKLPDITGLGTKVALDILDKEIDHRGKERATVVEVLARLEDVFSAADKGQVAEACLAKDPSKVLDALQRRIIPEEYFPEGTYDALVKEAYPPGYVPTRPPEKT